MRNRRYCPKCEGTKLWVVEGFGVKDPSVTYGGGMPLRIVARDPRKKPGFLGVENCYDAGKTDAWICASCGYTELWTSGLEGLVPNPEAGIHLVDGSRGYR